jgi:hypothetical protein
MDIDRSQIVTNWYPMLRPVFANGPSSTVRLVGRHHPTLEAALRSISEIRQVAMAQLVLLAPLAAFLLLIFDWKKCLTGLSVSDGPRNGRKEIMVSLLAVFAISLWDSKS